MYDARAHLRSRLRLLEPEPPAIASGAQLTLDDTSMLVLLEHLDLDFDAEEAKSRSRYANAITGASAGSANVPTFDDLQRDSWFQILFGRIVTPLRISVAAAHATAVSPGLPDLIRKRFTVTPNFTGVPRGNNSIDEAIRRLATGELRFIDIDCRTPGWVAARLWERRPLEKTDPFLWWLDRWALLERPPFSPSKVWDGAVARDFVELVLDRLEAEPALIGWSAIRQTIADQSMRAARQSGAGDLDRIPEVPDTIVARARWLGDPWLGGVPEMRAEAFEEVRDLLALVAGDIEMRRHSAVPDVQFGRLCEIALNRPDLLQMLVERALRHTLLISDFLTQPDTCAFGCWLLTLRSSGRLFTSDDAGANELASAALQDGLSLMQRFLREEAPGNQPAEAAALLAGAFDTIGRPRRLEPAEAAEAMVLGALAELGTAAEPIVDALAEMVADTLDAPAFVSALELVSAADLSETVTPRPLPGTYIGLISAGGQQLSVDRISPERAAALFQLASRCGPPQLRRFLYPLDWNEALVRLEADDYDARQKVVRSLVASTRTLASAIVGQAGGSPSELATALADHVLAGAEDDWANGRIWAFESRTLHLPWSRGSDLTLGTLLGRALSSLDEPAREPLLLACLALREPAILADIHKAAPIGCRQGISARIDDIGVDRAIAVHSLTAVNDRINSLLDAGLTAAAEVHMATARKQATLGKATERRRIEFNQDLRLLYQKGDWDAIAGAAIPADLPQTERELCERILESFQAIALLQDVNANPAVAVAKLEKLVRESPAELGHQVNLFAAKITAVLGPASFPTLAPSEQKPARLLLAQVEEWMATTAEATAEDRYICVSNLAPVDLAIGNPARALERLQTLPPERESATRAAYRAVAYGRLDRAADAHEELDKAFKLFGDNLLLQAARDHLVGDRSSGGLGATDRILFAPTPDEMQRLHAAVTRFLTSTSTDKAAILRNRSDALPGIVTEYIDNALSGVSNLATLINRGALRDDEDDITAIVKQLLNSAFRFLGWSTPDQCKGGFTPSGNYGERDLILVDGVTELAIIEAVIADRTVPKNNLVTHFRKLLGYGDCPLYFHLTYAWQGDTAHLIEVLKTIAKEEAPSDHAFEGLEVRARAGNSPDGFTAQYRVRGQVIQVVFRVLDLGQHRLRHAAASSSQQTNNPTRTPNSKKKPV